MGFKSGRVAGKNCVAATDIQWHLEPMDSLNHGQLFCNYIFNFTMATIFGPFCTMNSNPELLSRIALIKLQLDQASSMHITILAQLGSECMHAYSSQITTQLRLKVSCLELSSNCNLYISFSRCLPTLSSKLLFLKLFFPIIIYLDNNKATQLTQAESVGRV